MPEETPLRLSDMYRLKVEDPKLQLEAVMLNISGSNNSRLKEAVEKAINECIAEDVLKDFLRNQR